jgi:E3 ubiquitin-protein ligase RNF115/126
MASSPTAAPSYWCYQCDRFVRAAPQDGADDGSPSAAAGVACPACGGGFLEEMGAPPRAAYLRRPRAHHHRHAAADTRPRRGAASGDRASPFNPVIVLRRAQAPGDGDDDGSPAASFELFYDDGAGSGLRPLPESMSGFLMGSGFERLLDQLAQIEAAAAARDNPPASKAAVESMPTVTVAAHDSHCAVCKEPFDLGAEAREMPCRHIYHHDCILPWLQLRNSCPVCRHEMPTDAPPRSRTGGEEEEAATVGLTIWRLPGGGFAVGRFAGGRRPEERELPVVYTEMDGGFNNGGAAPRRISWGSRQNPSAETSTIRRVLRSVFSCFGRGHSSSSQASSSRHARPDTASDAFSHGSRSRTSSWRLEDGHADATVQR